MYKTFYYEMNDDGTEFAIEEWHELQTTDEVELDLDNMQFTVTISQDDYLSSIIHDYETVASATDIPKYAMIEACFMTVDLASTSYVEDCVTLKVMSSGENAAELCDFSGLSIEGTMGTAFEYKVPASDANPLVKELYAPIKLSGIESVSPSCVEQVHFQLQYKNLNDRWVALWSELHDEEDDQSVKHTANYTVWYLDVSHEEYVEDIRPEFDMELTETTVDVECRFVFADGADNAIDSTATEFTVTIIDENALNDTCATAEVTL
jgi:hypothetical protein